MNLPTRFPLAGAALALIVLAGPALAEEPTVLAPVTLQTQSPMRAHVPQSDMRLLSGTYRMEDGRDLEVNGRGLRLRITLGDEATVAMTPMADGTWHSVDGEVHMRFAGDAFGSPDTVVLSVPRKHWGLASVSRR